MGLFFSPGLAHKVFPNLINLKQLFTHSLMSILYPCPVCHSPSIYSALRYLYRKLKWDKIWVDTLLFQGPTLPKIRTCICCFKSSFRLFNGIIYSLLVHAITIHVMMPIFSWRGTKIQENCHLKNIFVDISPLPSYFLVNC